MFSGYRGSRREAPVAVVTVAGGNVAWIVAAAIAWPAVAGIASITVTGIAIAIVGSVSIARPANKTAIAEVSRD